MDSLPIDTSHPAVRDYLSLVRLQVLTPLSLLINIASVLVCAIVVHPSIGGVSKFHPTSISPKPAVIAVYVIAIYVGQIGYSILLVLARKPETKKTLIKGVGLPLVFANWVMAIWAVTWVLEWLLISSILQGILLLLLTYSNLALLIYHPPTSSRPFDTALIHAPLRFFFVLQFGLMFPYSIFVTLNLGPFSSPYPGLGVVLGTNLVGLLVILIRRDIVWCVAATWICVSIWTAHSETLPKPRSVFISTIVFTVLHPLGLISSLLYHHFQARQQRGAIFLEEDDERVISGNEPPRGRQNANGRQNSNRQEEGPREVDPDTVWA